MLRLKKSIDFYGILTSGACFRYIVEEDGSITNILKDRVINIKEDGEYVDITSSNYDNLKEIIYEYFDLNRDYDYIHKELINNNKDLTGIINASKGYRILNQDSFEMCISYIISQNNNVKRISNSINDLCKRYGKEILFNNKKYYLFPEYESIKDISLEELRNLKIGFRDKYIRNFLDYYPGMLDLNKLSTSEALNELMKVSGIGLKVASCILLFGYKRLDTFPVDTWVRHYMSKRYNISDNQKDIKAYADKHFGNYSGLILQYMFNNERNIKE